MTSEDGVFFFETTNPSLYAVSNGSLLSRADNEEYRVLNDVVGIWITGCICLLGLTGNCISFVVLQRTFGSNSPMFYVLRAMSLSDAVFLLTVFTVQTAVNIHSGPSLLQTLYQCRGYVQYIVWPVLMTTQMSTVWLTVLVSCERYVAICRPLDVASVCTVSRVRRAVFAILLISILFNVPRYVEVRIDDTGQNLVKTDFGNSEFYRYAYTCVLYSMILFIAPLLLLVVLNIRLVMALHKGRNDWIHLQVVQRREQTLTAIPLTIVLVFFVCGTPSLVVNVVDSINPELMTIHPHFVSFMLFANFLVVVNSASNIIVYCLVGRKFRSKLIEMFQCKACHFRGRTPLHGDVRSSTTGGGATVGAMLRVDWSSRAELHSGTTKSPLRSMSRVNGEIVLV